MATDGLVPAGIAASSRRFYEALVAKCVPLLLADAFQPAFAELLPLEQYAVRAAQDDPAALPAVVASALERWSQLYEGVEAARSAFIYDGGWHPSARASCDATQAILAELQATPDQACFVGDDVNDLAVMAMAGLSVAVADAETAVLKAAHHVTRCVGGGGAIREIVELILTAQGRWNA
jgi:hydroxymethylpyrimidine pyrophosphatase-like HAD family hydrolase